MEQTASKFVYTEGNLYRNVHHACETFPDKLAYEFMGAKTSYKKFMKDVDQCAKALVALGVKEDEVVCIAMPNVPQAITMFYALNKIGAVANMIHPLSSEKEMEMFLNRVKAGTLLMMDQFYASVQKIRANTGVENVIIASIKEVLPGYMKLPYQLTAGKKVKKIPAGEKVIYWGEFMKLSSRVPALPEVGDRTDKLAAILHSGGTTGKIKGVCLSNKSINCCIHQMLSYNPMIGSQDKMITVMPIFHGNGLFIGVHAMLSIGAQCVLIPRFTPESYAKDLLKHKCNYMSGVPTLFGRMFDAPVMKNADLSFLKGVFSGADYLSPELENRLNEFLKSHNSSVFVRQGYGMTEGVVATTLMPVDRSKPGSIGQALPGVTLKIVEPGTDKEVPTGEIGEIVFSSVTNMMCYYEDPEETAITLKKHSDGLEYVHSGDLGSVDEEGFVYFKGRIKRMIVTNGYNVFPMDLENIIEGNEMVDRCCVIGVPDKERIEKVKAFIILKAGIEKSDETREQLKEFFKKNIARYAVPREIEFIDELPKTKVGKVDFKLLMNKEIEKQKQAEENKEPVTV